MGCGNCSTGGGCTPAGCKSNGSCMTNGCSKLDVYDWLAHMDMPSSYKPFQVVEIKFKGSRKDFYLNADNIYLEAGELVAVETATGGYDIGHVSLTGELVRMQMVKRHVKEADVTKKIYRRATPADVDKWKLAKELEWETMHKARKLALDLNLSMKISDVDYQGDKTKATFYYTAEGRVDFRELIKKMAEAFRIRIEMRQIGMRQEASRLGGIGSCGRELCCSTWLTDFKTVSTSAARYQNLSLNTLKLAGQCGKLKCCLNYELDGYMDALKHIPDNVNVLRTEKGDARLQKTDIFKRMMWFSLPGAENWIPLPIARVKEIQKLNKDGVTPEDLVEEIAAPAVVAKVLDYENVVGQDSLTRLDERSQNRNKKKKNKKPGSGNSPQQPTDKKPQQQAGDRKPQQQNNQQKPGNQPKQNNQQRPVPAAIVNNDGQNNAPVADGLKAEDGHAKRNNRRHRPNRNRGNNNNNNQQPQKPAGMMLTGKLYAYLLLSCIVIGSLTSCSDPNRVMDENKSITNHNWSYGNKIKYDVDIPDAGIAYNLYLNVRVTSNYKYSNMFVLVYQNGGGSTKANITRYELKLASPTGEWLGKGSGSMYSYQIPFKKQYRFPAKGKYHFEIEQNMRDNPLRSVSDVGLRVEKAE